MIDLPTYVWNKRRIITALIFAAGAIVAPLAMLRVRAEENVLASAVPRIVFDGWMATMPADWRDRLPRQFEHVRRRPGEERQGVEELGTFDEQTAAALLETLEWTDGVSLEALPQVFARARQSVEVGSGGPQIKVETQSIGDDCFLSFSSAQKIVNEYLEEQNLGGWGERVKPGAIMALLLPESAPVIRSRLLMLRISRDDSGNRPEFVIEQPPDAKTPARKPKPGARADDAWAQNILFSWMSEAQPDGTIPRRVLSQLMGDLKGCANQYPNSVKGEALKVLAERAESLEHSWTIPELSKLLDDIRAVDPAPLGRLERGLQSVETAKAEAAARSRAEIVSPEESKVLAFGPAAKNGLRAACVLEPAMAGYPLGEIVECKLIFQNSGAETVKFDTLRARLICQGEVRKPDGKEIAVSGDWDPFFRNLSHRVRIELKPGQALAIDVRGAAIGGQGEFDFEEEYAKGTIGFGFLAEAGDEVHAAWQVQLPGTNGSPVPPSPGAWQGNLQTGEVRFAVEKEKPRVETAIAPGSYRLVPGGSAKEQAPVLGDLFNTAHRPTLNIVRETLDDDSQRDEAVIHWPATEKRPAAEHRIALSAEGGKYIVAWRRRGSSLWIADEKELRQVSFDDPAKIVENTFARLNGGGFGELPPDVLAEIEKAVPIERKVGVGETSSAQRIETAATVEGWIVEGVVADADGKVIPDVAVRVTSEDQSIDPLGNALTGADGRYLVRFRSNLATLAKSRNVSATVVAPGWKAKNGDGAGDFTLLLKQDEAVERKEGSEDLILGRVGRLDFTMAPDGR